MATVHDPYRIDYLRGHIQAMKKAINEDGVDLRAYTPWGCIDLISASTGEMKNAMVLCMWTWTVKVTAPVIVTVRTVSTGIKKSLLPMVKI